MGFPLFHGKFQGWQGSIIGNTKFPQEAISNYSRRKKNITKYLFYENGY